MRGEFRGGDSKADIEGDDPQSGDSKVSRSVVGIGHVQGGSDDKANGGENGRKNLRPHPHVWTESEPSRGGRDTDGKGADRADPHLQSDIGNRTPTISTLHVGESEGT